MSEIVLATLWIKRKGDPDVVPECILCWDEYAIEENYDGWQQAVEAALQSIGSDLDSYRLFSVSVPLKPIAHSFHMQNVKAGSVSQLDDPRSL